MSASPLPSDEKSVDHLNSPGVIEEVEALEGYMIDPSHYVHNAARLKTSKDGRFVLIPQPLDSPEDPLNWKESKKLRIVAIIAYVALLADYTGGTAIITVIPQSMLAFNISMDSPLLANFKMIDSGDYLKKRSREPLWETFSRLGSVD
ncbi:hypothetical protein N7488_009762 [Penicillium malachiteum]|nr:hypothetical protein N7488_009762 [Penicillium malachiteum]